MITADAMGPLARAAAAHQLDLYQLNIILKEIANLSQSSSKPSQISKHRHFEFHSNLLLLNVFSLSTIFLKLGTDQAAPE